MSANINHFMHDVSNQVYQEDVEALEWSMDMVLSQAFELSFALVKPGLMARSIMYHLAMEEHS